MTDKFNENLKKVCLSSWFGIVPNSVSKKRKWHYLDKIMAQKKSPTGLYSRKAHIVKNVRAC